MWRKSLSPEYVLVMRVVDLLYASGREERKRILITGGLFALAGALTFYTTLPYLWELYTLVTVH